MNENKKEWNVKELAEKNIFVQNSKAIKFIADSHNVDVGVALDIFCTERNLKYGTENYLEFLKVARDITLNKMVEELE